MRLDTGNIEVDASAISHIRVDRIGGAGDGLWWVAEALKDGSAKPEGMFVSEDDAMRLAQNLAETWHVDVRVTTDPSAS